MSAPRARLDSGGRIDRNKPLRFTFDGRSYTGYAGDTLASALLANGVVLTGRSFRYRRPRGIFSAGVEECHALVTLGSGASLVPNVRATVQPLCDGLVAHSQRGWPSLKWDLGALSGRLSGFLPVGFYYKTFIWPRWSWYEKLIRRAAGGAKTPSGPDPDLYEKRHAHCDLLVIGMGPAGLAAALAAARSGLRIVVVDNQPEPGGSLLWNDAPVENREGAYWARRTADRLATEQHVTVLHRTTVTAAWDHGYFTALQDSGGEQAAQVLWRIRSRHTILASGAIEQPMVFPDNDRPGTMLADAARQYLNRYAVRPGREAVVYTNNDGAYKAARELNENGVHVKAIVDVRAHPPDRATRQARDCGIEVLSGHEVVGTRGYWRLRAVAVRPLPETENPSRRPLRIAAGLLCVSGGWNPTLHLFSQAGGKLRYDDSTACFVPAQPAGGYGCAIFPVGAANGTFELSACLREGHEAGLDAVERLLGGRPEDAQAPSAADEAPYTIQPRPATAPPARGRQWIDHLHDVTHGSISVAAREGYTETSGAAAFSSRLANALRGSRRPGHYAASIRTGRPARPRRMSTCL